jgi:hypothetical protein
MNEFAELLVMVNLMSGGNCVFNLNILGVCLW